jgi:hypothetical protein
MTDSTPTLEEAGAPALLVSPAGALLIDVRSAGGRAGAGQTPGATVVDEVGVATASEPTHPRSPGSEPQG